MEGMKAIPYIALVIAISGIIIGASAITLDKFGDTITQCTVATDTWNATSMGGCQNSSGAYTSNATTEFRAVLDASSAQADLGEQLPTVAIIGIMVIIISVIAGVFVYLRYFS